MMKKWVTGSHNILSSTVSGKYDHKQSLISLHIMSTGKLQLLEASTTGTFDFLKVLFIQ